MMIFKIDEKIVNGLKRAEETIMEWDVI